MASVPTTVLPVRVIITTTRQHGRRLQVDRMRRYAARSVPLSGEWTLPLYPEQADVARVQADIDAWGASVRAVHGPGTITSRLLEHWTTDDDSPWDGRTVRAVYHPHRPTNGE